MTEGTEPLTVPIVTEGNLGTSYAHGWAPGFAFDEFEVFDRVLTAAEIATIYALQRPLVDYGAIEKPFLSILDGGFLIASSVTGNRIQMDADEIAGYNSAGTKQFYLQASDGKAMAGAGAVTLDEDGITATAGTIGGWTLGADYLSSSSVFLNSSGSIIVGTGSNVVALGSMSDTWRLWVGAAAPGGAPFRVTKTGVLTAEGATISGAITATSGDLGTLDVSGSLTMGAGGELLAGAVTLNTSGIAIAIGSGTANRLRLLLSGIERGSLWGQGTTNVTTQLLSGPPSSTSYTAKLNLLAKSNAGDLTGFYVESKNATTGSISATVCNTAEGSIRRGYCRVENNLRVGKGLTIGSALIDPNDGEFHFGSATYRLRRNGIHLEWYNGSNWVQLD
jgi:hypothetical protein